MLNFNTSIQDTIATQEKATRTSAFTEYNSKKKLFAAGILNEEQKKHIQDLKGTFTFHLHTDNRYLVVTMYYSSTKTYGFIIVDLQTLQCAEAASIKLAKKGVLEVIAEAATPEVADETKEPEAPAAEEEAKSEETTESPNEPVVEDKPKRNRRK